MRRLAVIGLVLVAELAVLRGEVATGLVKTLKWMTGPPPEQNETSDSGGGADKYTMAPTERVGNSYTG